MQPEATATTEPPALWTGCSASTVDQHRVITRGRQQEAGGARAGGSLGWAQHTAIRCSVGEARTFPACPCDASAGGRM